MLDMQASLLWFSFLGLIVTSCARPISLSTSPIVPSALNSTGGGLLTPSHMIGTPVDRVITRRHLHELANALHDQQTGAVTPFPKFAVVLLALFIIVCAISSAIVTVLFYSKRARERVTKVTRRVWGTSMRFRRNRTAGKGPDGRNGENVKSEREEKVLDITQNTSAPSFPGNGDGYTSESTAASSVEKVNTSLTLSTGDAPGPNNEEKAPSPQISKHSVSSGGSRSSDPMRILISASTTVLRHLTNIVSPTDGDVNVPSVAQAEHPSNSVLPLTTRGSPTPLGKDDNGTHSFQHSTSSTTFYSLADVLSPSAAVHSLVDMIASVAHESNPATTPGPLGPSDESDFADGLSSPRYVPGVQLETIREESENSSSTGSELARLASLPIPSSSTKSFMELSADLDSHSLSIRDLNPPIVFTHTKTASEQSTDTRLFATTSLTDRIPTTWEELAIDPQNPTLPRFYPAARPAPLRSEPTSATAFVSALRSPERDETRHSVAWLSPVVEWAVDDPQEDWDEEDTTIRDDEDECEDALHAADAMAVVMDSLAAVGVDPTDMGLTTEGVSLSISDPFMEYPHSLPGALGSHEYIQRHTALDLVEEEEVEEEVGIEAKSSTSEVFDAGEAQGEADIGIPRPLHLIVSSLTDHPNSSKGAYDIGNFGGMLEGNNIAHDSDLSESSGYSMEQHQKVTNKISKFSYASGSVGSQSSSQSFRTPRGVKPDRLYPSPSSLAGLTPTEVSKRFSTQSTSSTTSTPSPRGKNPLFPQHHFSPVSPLQVRPKTKRTSLSPTLRSTPSTLTASPRNDLGSPSSRSQSLMLYQNIPASPSTPRFSGSPRHSTSSTRPLSPRKNLDPSSPSPISHVQRYKPAAMSQLTRSTSILQERSNSMEFV